jgi:hypothetical protein
MRVIMLNRGKYMRAVCGVMVSVLLVSLACAGQERPLQDMPLATYNDRECGFSFQFQTDWKVDAQYTRNHPCAASLYPVFPIPEAPAEVGVVTVELVKEPLESALKHAAFKRDEHGIWVLLGRGGEGDAREISSHDWTGVKGTVASGCYDQKEGYMGLCDVFAAVLSDGHSRSVVIRAGPQGEVAFEQIVKSFKFSKAAKPCR